MSDPGALKIAGQLTAADWQRRKVGLVPGRTPEAWRAAFEDFFVARLQTRYLEPIRRIEAMCTNDGEGFAIVTLQCALIEFLEATRKGTKYVRGKADPAAHEYSQSSKVFVDFLTSAPPFNDLFNKALAEDFYVGVRCGLLHEARTKKGWTIHVWGDNGPFLDPGKKIIYRDRLQVALDAYVDGYGNSLVADQDLQAAFVRKFDHLCEA